MKKITGIIALVLAGSLSTMAQTTTESMNRIETCKDNYRTLFGSEALTGQGTDPEMMDILQKFIFGEVFQTGKLTMKQREMITCITLATMQTLPQLKAHAGAALNVGVTPEELREVMYLTAPFIGFPKMLNAVAAVNEVLKERGIPLPLEKQGTVTEDTRHVTGKAIQDKLYPGGIASVMEGLPDGMGKDVERFLTDYFFGEIYSRGAIDLQTRELLGYCVLTTLEAESQLQSHYHGNMNVGNTPETLTAAVIQCLPYIGFPAAIKALRIIKQEYARPVSAGNNLVRLSKITVDAAQLDAYNAFLKEEIEASMRLEPGVLTLYATAEKDNPNKMTILEIYADRAAYESHLKTPHFQKYKQGTLSMVKELELVDVKPLIPGLKIK
ncbi:carboxymuconolactone decarboxylase family protein [Mediterranea massiliensis]|uniref:carboxymuconolactone decarboxylase family protein n=1 Tax=Mediterranea massiliensis TaxID=1841865 RepID=UPI0023F42EB1|nr:carboxymuconolactone decarboxylase family protein [Mediterranea massiliensis]